jgi:GT2 family glycosyltransferase
VRIGEVVVIHHRTPALLARALRRWTRVAPGLPLRVLDTGGELDARADAPGAQVERIANHSYAAAVNHALKRGPGDAAIVMNADVLVADDTLEALRAPFGDPDVALVGPLGRTPDGRLQDMGLPYRAATRAVAGRGPAATVDVPWLSGFLFAARRAAARDAGGMDAGLRFFNEDLEWCLRLRRAGWRCRLVGAEVEHVGGAATPAAGRFLVEGLRGGMVVADRYRGSLRREAQRAGLALAAAWMARRGSPEARTAWRAVGRMVRAGRYDLSPFGDELADDAPGFPDAWPPQEAR